VLAAALCHDVLEDTDYPEARLREALGEDAYDMVKPSLTTLPALEEKKKKYIETVRLGSAGAKAICLADKIHNLESLFIAYSQSGPAVWKNFNRGRNRNYGSKIQFCRCSVKPAASADRRIRPAY